jgi:hypothetical protein
MPDPFAVIAPGDFTATAKQLANRTAFGLKASISTGKV